jgi:hypothetical protein
VGLGGIVTTAVSLCLTLRMRADRDPIPEVQDVPMPGER